MARGSRCGTAARCGAGRVRASPDPWRAPSGNRRAVDARQLVRGACHELNMPEIFDDVGHCVDAVLRRVGPRIVLALPLGIGKPNPLANEFYRRAVRDPGLSLTIFTALSLLKPVARAGLEARLVGPLTER